MYAQETPEPPVKAMQAVTVSVKAHLMVLVLVVAQVLLEETLLPLEEVMLTTV
jgi:hypothetical protein